MTGIVLVVVTLTKFTAGGWISMLFMAILFVLFSAVHRHYDSVMKQLRRGVVHAGDFGVNHMVLVIRDLDAAAAEAVGVVRSIRPTELHILHPTDDPIPPDLQERWREFSMNAPPLEPLRLGKDNLLDAREAVRAGDRARAGRLRERRDPGGGSGFAARLPVPPGSP